jgi:hypothetical protein
MNWSHGGMASVRGGSVLRGAAIAAAIAAASSTGTLLGGSVLDRHANSLTTYRPSSTTSVQGVRPHVNHRTVNIDGSGNWPQAAAMSGGPSSIIAKNPPDPPINAPGIPPIEWSGCGEPGNPGAPTTPPNGGAVGGPQPSIDGIDLGTGSLRTTEIDFRLASPGFSWTVARSYSAAQANSGGTAIDSDGFQGRNWFQDSQPEIVFYDNATDSEDMVYVVWGAAAYSEFKRESTSNVFKGKNGTNALVEFSSGTGGEPDLWTLTNSSGVATTFFASGAANGQLWKIVDPAGNTAYVGDATTASTAVSSGYSSGRITTAYDSADRRYTYTYTTLDSVSRLTQVKVETKSGGTWASPTGLAEVAKVDYTYYVTGDSDLSYGEIGNLKLVKVTTPLTDSGVSSSSRRYYRYYTGTYDASTNRGQSYLLKHVLDAEGCRRLDLTDSDINDADLFAATDSDVRTYARMSFKYDSSKRINETYGYGQCGCGGGATNGVSTISYDANGSYSDNSGYDTAWKSRAVVSRPDGTYLTQYVDEAGQGLSRVITPTDPATSTATQWTTYVTRDHASDADLDGLVQEVSEPNNVTAYTHSTASFTRSSTAGVVRTFSRVTSGDMKGLVTDRKHSRGGSGGSQYLDSTTAYDSGSPTVTKGSTSIVRPLVSGRKQYFDAATSTGSSTDNSEVTTAYTYHSGSGATRPKAVTVTYPAVGTAKNGENVTDTSVMYLRADGTVAFTKSPDGIYTYTQYSNGQLVKRIDDCQTNHATDFASGDDPNTDFGITETGSGLRQVTTYAYDAQGRATETTIHAHGSTDADKIVRKSYYSTLADGKLVTLGYSDFVSSSGTFYGPISYSVTNQAGSPEFQATVAIASAGITTAITSHIDEGQTDALAALDIGTVSSVQTAVFDDSGHQRTESRTYFSIPSSMPGTEGTHYDATRYAYDTSNRMIRTKTPDGTITRTYFDSKARPYQTKVGTNDNGETSGESSGTNDMTLVSETVYDDATNRVTSTKQFYDTGSGDHRDTEYLYDIEGRRKVTKSPSGPISVVKYDQQGRTVAQGTYKSTASVTAGTDPTSVTTDRLALSETGYDQRGRVWKTTRHEINQSTGASSSTLTAEHWFDKAGREIKTDGEQLTKTVYDRLGRATRSFTLAKDDDTAYADADDVTGDIVLEERQTLYDATDGTVLMTVSIERNYNDYRTGETTGALDSNADGDFATVTMANVKGRVSISASWYDALDRMTDAAAYGTNNGSDFTRPGSVPSRSSTVLVSSTAYYDDGSVMSTTDPRGKVSYQTYDAAQRVTATYRNYVNGSPSSATGDDDQIIRQVYANGLRTKYWVDLYPADTNGTPDGEDQVTTYTYGVSKGVSAGDSKVAAGNLLQKVEYPDSSGGSDVVTFAYDTSRALMWKKDQAGNVIETGYDSAGRKEHERVTTLAGGFDGQVRRITTAYDDRGMVSTVTSYDNATPGSGSAVNQVRSSYDGWANLTTFEADPDSTIGSSGIPVKSVSYTYATATTGRNTIRRTGVTLPGSTAVTYVYDSGTNGLYDSEASRVSKMSISSVNVARYRYLGFGNVVGVDYDEADVYQHRYGTTTGTYPDLDRFGRVLKSRWTKDLSTDMDFVSVDVGYDENSNPLTTEENIYDAGFDVKYAIDGMDRVTDADEGTLSGGSITSRTRRQQWTLTQTGNWDNEQLDLNGDGDKTDADEHDDTRTHNAVNELTARDTDSDSTNDYSLAYDAAGNLTDDGETYAYEYDAWYRLRKIKDRGTSAVLSEHQYYGNGFRAGEHYDADQDSDVDSNDPWYWFAYDERWRIVATFVGSDDNSHVKERFLHHTAGGNGYGSSSYIDQVVLRERDANTNWHASSDGTLEERLYYCQNWRHDVVALVTAAGALTERVRYSSYGVPFGIPLGDCDSDGDVDSADQSILLGAWGTSSPKCDLDLSGTIDATDQSVQLGNSGATGGIGQLTGNRSRLGYAGYAADGESASRWHVRRRWVPVGIRGWSQRDPSAYVDGPSLYESLRSGPLRWRDSTGLSTNGWTQVETVDKYASCSWGKCDFRFFGFAAGHSSDGENICTPVFVQRVFGRAKCGECVECGPPQSSDVKFEYWEMFEGQMVAQGEKGVVFGFGDFVDRASQRIPNGTFGNVSQHGEVRFYCKEWFTQAGIASPFSGWVPGLQTPLGKWCGDFVGSGLSPATGSKPPWWDSGAVTQSAGASRAFEMSWKCGCPPGDPKVSCSPRNRHLSPQYP